MKYTLPIVSICIAIITAIFICNHKNTEIKYTTGKIIEHDSVIVHDTIYKKIAIKNISVSREKVLDSVKDSSICYSCDQSFPDSTSIKSKICSKDLPKIKPVDLSWSLTYKPKKDTLKTITRIDTMTIIKKPKIKPVYYVIAGALAGAIVVGIIKR